MLKDNDTVYCNLKLVSRSGMTRHIQFFIIRDDMPIFITYKIANLLDWKMNKWGDAIKVQGCGMDMGFHVVHTLADKLGISLNHRWI
jgi:hypothetical protein